MPRTRRDRDTIFEDSLFNNRLDYENILSRLIDLAVGRFTIKNLPKEIYEPFVLRTLVTQNEILFFQDDVTSDYIAYPYIFNGGLDIYNRPTKRRVVCPNGYQRTDLDESNSVIIKGSNSGQTIMPIIESYARQLFIMSRTIDINVNAQKTPILLLCEDGEQNTINNLYYQYNGNAPVIKGEKSLMQGISMQALSTNAPFVADKIYDLFAKKWNEYLTFLGIANVNEKKERLVSDEVNRMLGGVVVARNNFTRAISRGLDEANKMFGLDMQLLFATDEEGESAIGEDESEVQDNE